MLYPEAAESPDTDIVYVPTAALLGVIVLLLESFTI
jgi:hypothetical protein